MNQTDLASALIELTGDLSIGPAATRLDLLEARSAIARALASGQSMRAIHLGATPPKSAIEPSHLGEPELKEIHDLATAVARATRSPTEPEPRALVRTAMVRSVFDPATPEWARGMEVDRSYGPFLSQQVRPVWIDILRTLRQMKLVRMPGNGFVGTFPVRLGPALSPRRFLLGRGSIWFNARLLAAACPAGSFTGFRIRGGRLDLSADAVVNNDELRIPAEATATLTVDLDPPAQPPLSSGPGADVTREQVQLPSRVTIEFTSTHATVTALSDSDAKVFGSKVHLVRNIEPPSYDDSVKQIVVPCAPTHAKFEISDSVSRVFTPSKKAKIIRAGWALPVAITTPAQLGAAAGAGAVYLSLDAGLEATWGAIPHPIPSRAGVLLASPGQLFLLLHMTGAPFAQTFLLWEETPVDGQSRRSNVVFRYPKAYDVLYIAIPGFEEIVIQNCGLDAHVDRPVRADGLRVKTSSPVAALVVADSAQGEQVLILGSMPAAAQSPIAPIDIENALLGTHAPSLLIMAGAHVAGTIPSGALSLSFGLRYLLPTLPDPYAATFSTRPHGDTDIGQIVSVVRWASPSTPKLAFSLPQGGQNAFAGISGLANLAVVRATPALALLDVSTNADQLGVAFQAGEQASALTIEGLSLSASGNNILIFTVPELSWEPMDNAPNPLVVNPRVDELLNPPDDGGPSWLQVRRVQMTPIAPLPTVRNYVNAVRSGEPFRANLTLPFGLRATINAEGDIRGNGGEFAFNDPAFEGLKGGKQIVMKPPHADRVDATFPGTMHTHPESDRSGNPPPPLASKYGAQVIGLYTDGKVGVADLLNLEFGPEAPHPRNVPLRRYDFCGYGASVFSDWRDPNAAGPSIIKVRFDALVGRTAYEVIQAASIIYPWGIKAVRTITIERRRDARVVRRDSGWQPASDGELQFPPFTPRPGDPGAPPDYLFAGHTLLGPIHGLFNIRNISEQGAAVVVGGVTFNPVYFDADVKIDPGLVVESGGITRPTGTFVHSRGVRGYLMMLPPGRPAERIEVGALLKQTGPARGPIACTVRLGPTGPRMNVTAVDCSRAGADADPDLVIALRGAPVLPRDGAWSVARQSGSNAPESLGVNDAVPLVRHPTAAPVQWHWADPEDIRSLNAPIRQYGLLQSTGTQKLFFGRPSVVQGQSKVQIPNPPRLADIGTLLNATGAFPHLTDALPFSPGAAESLDVSEQGLAIHKHNIDLSPAGTRTLLGFDSVPLEVLIDYRNARADVDIDPLQTPRWSVTVTGLNFPLITPFSSDVNDPIISIKGGFHADSESAATLDNLTVVYGSMLKPVQDLFSSLKDLCTFLPGGGGAALDVSFSNGMLTIRDEFALPTLPLGFGHIEGVAIMLGMTLQLSPASLEFTAGIGSEKKPFTWLVSPLSGTGAIEVGAKDSDVTFLIQGGIGVGLSIDIGIASGSASITLAIQVDNKIKPFEIKGILTGNASVDVLGGLASASLTLSAALGLVPRFPPIPDEIVVTAAVSVGIHISICWVVSIDFDGTWSFEQTFESPVSL